MEEAHAERRNGGAAGSGGGELGRLVGYPGSDFFYSLLGEALARLPRQRGGNLPSGIAPAAEGAARVRM